MGTWHLPNWLGPVGVGSEPSMAGAKDDSLKASSTSPIPSPGNDEYCHIVTHNGAMAGEGSLCATKEGGLGSTATPRGVREQINLRGGRGLAEPHGRHSAGAVQARVHAGEAAVAAALRPLSPVVRGRGEAGGGAAGGAE